MVPQPPSTGAYVHLQSTLRVCILRILGTTTLLTARLSATAGLEYYHLTKVREACITASYRKHPKAFQFFRVQSTERYGEASVQTIHAASVRHIRDAYHPPYSVGVNTSRS